MAHYTPEARALRQRMLNYLRHTFGQHGYLPTITDMTEQFEVSRSTVLFHLRMLREEGKLTYQDGKVARTLVLL